MIEGLSGLAANGEGGLISVEALRRHISDALKNNPNQTFKLYSSRETNSEGIILARATAMESLSTNLAEIERKLNCGDFRELILGADALWVVLKERPNYEQAGALRERLENALSECKERSRRWLLTNANAMSWMKFNPAGYDAMMTFVVELSLERIGEESTKQDGTLGLFAAMARVVQKNGNFKDLAPYLPKTESSKMPAQLQAKMGKNE